MDEDSPVAHAAVAPPFRLGCVPGVTPSTWVRTWRERHRADQLVVVPLEAAAAEAALREGAVDAALLRPPVDREVLGSIPLYEETVVVVVGRDHLLAALAEDEPATLADLASEVVLHPLDDVVAWSGDHQRAPGDASGAPPRPGVPGAGRPATTKDAVELVAAGAGVLAVPQSLARLHHRKDVTYRMLAGAPPAPVSLAWVTERADDRVEDLIGIVRGRTVNSSRGRQAPAPARDPRPTRSPGPVTPSRSGRAPHGRTRRRGR